MYAENARWDSGKFLTDLCKSEVYVAPLQLEDGAKNTFLETRFEIQNSQNNLAIKSTIPLLPRATTRLYDAKRWGHWPW